MISKSIKNWRVEKDICSIYGEIMRGISLDPLKHPLAIEKYKKIWFELIFISICHQTNWDKLYSYLAKLFHKHSFLLDPNRLCGLSFDEFNYYFKNGFDSNRSRLEERYEFLKILATFFSENGFTSLTEFSQKKIRLQTNDGFYSFLDKISIFSEDPLRKKSRVLVHQLLKYNLIQIDDPENILPAIDYHLIRLYLRTGRVQAQDHAMNERLLSNLEFSEEEITILRTYVDKAIMYTAAFANIRVDVLNHYEWQIARSFCIKNAPRCSQLPLPEKQIDQNLKRLSAKNNFKCPYSHKCFAVQQKSRSINEPASNSSFY